MSTFARTLPLALAGSLLIGLPATVIAAEAAETWIEILSPEDGSRVRLGSHLDFEVEGEVVNQRGNGQDYYVVVRIMDDEYDVVWSDITHLGELDHGETLPYAVEEVIDTSDLALGTWYFSASIGPHWKLAPDDYVTHQVSIVRNYVPVRRDHQVE